MSNRQLAITKIKNRITNNQGEIPSFLAMTNERKLNNEHRINQSLNHQLGKANGLLV
jgi:hypothetical protein